MTPFGHCENCGKPIYFGPRMLTQMAASNEATWRHVGSENRKCSGPIPKAWPREPEWQPMEKEMWGDYRNRLKTGACTSQS
jgi:hypothetical protein